MNEEVYSLSSIINAEFVVGLSKSIQQASTDSVEHTQEEFVWV